MTTNEQIETAKILQMRKDLDEARKLLASFVKDSKPSWTVWAAADFLARTEPKHGETK